MLFIILLIIILVTVSKKTKQQKNGMKSIAPSPVISSRHTYQYWVFEKDEPMRNVAKKHFYGVICFAVGGLFWWSTLSAIVNGRNFSIFLIIAGVLFLTGGILFYDNIEEKEIFEKYKENSDKQRIQQLQICENATSVSAVDLYSEISPRDYEILCTIWMRGHGFYNVETTQYARDFGADIVGYYNGIKYIAQCKRYNNPVGSSDLQKIGGSMIYYKAPKALFFTTSSYTDDARKVARELGVELIILHQDGKTIKVQ